MSISKKNRLFTSESVSEGHPDKVCDQISDAVLDACLSADSDSHVACETFATTAFVLVGGEITTNTYVEVREIVRAVLEDIGYTDAAFGMDCKAVAVSNMIQRQCPEIDQGVRGRGLPEFAGRQGAGDQGMMFGFACDETAELMPAPIMLAHRILRLAAEKRKTGVIPWLRPDAKSQVTLEYDGNTPIRAHTIVVSHQHNDGVAHGTIEEGIIEGIVKPALADTGFIDSKTKFFINPTGSFVTGGPMGDTGLTGRKIIVDTYGGMGRHGGGAFSGKDPSKVDRSASYMARHIAKTIVAAGLASRAEVQLSYAIGVPFPISTAVDTFGTGSVPDEEIAAAVEKTFDCSPEGIIKALDLKKPIYRKTVNYGHFGRKGFAWEEVGKTAALKAAL